MDIAELTAFWRGRQAEAHGIWCHEEDRELLGTRGHRFNLDYPVSPYVGNVLDAPVVILNANAGYNPAMTPSEFPDAAAFEAYVARVDNPTGADWTGVSQYYDGTNYGHLVLAGKAALVNACAYRSPKISEEPENRVLIRRLPSCMFTRNWLLEALLPAANRGERLVVAKRYGLWDLPPEVYAGEGVVKDTVPAGKHLAAVTKEKVEAFLESR